MTNGVAHAALPAAVGPKTGSSGARRHDGAGFGKALEGEGAERGRSFGTRLETQTASSARWSRTADLLASTLVPATPGAPAGADAAQPMTEARPGPETAGLEGAAELTSDEWQDLPQHAATRVTDFPPEDERATSGTVLDTADDEAAEAGSTAPSAPAEEQPPEAPADDLVADLKRTLAARNTEKAVEGTSREAVEAGGEDGEQKDEVRSAQAEAPRTRFPEPLIYMAPTLTAGRPAPIQTEAPADTASADRRLGAKVEQPPAVVDRAPGANVAVPPSTLAGVESTLMRPSVGPAPDGPARPQAPVPDQEAEPAKAAAGNENPRPPTPVATQNSTPPAASSEPAPQAQPGASAPERPALAGLAPGGHPGTAEKPSDAPDPRRSGEQPMVVPRAEVVSDKAFVAPPAQPALPASPTLTSLAGAIAAASASQRAAESVGITPPTDANGTRTLQIQLNPADLGMVTAHLRTSGERLSIELRVDTAEAYHRLSRDRDAIVASLKGHGYDIDTVTIVQPQAASTPTARADANPNPTGTPDRNGGQLASGNSGSGGNGGSGRAPGQQENSNFQGSEVNAQILAGRSGDDVYI